MFSKKVVGWNLTERQRAKEVVATLKEAISKRNPEPGLIIHSDKGSQMRSNKYRTFLSDNNFVPSYTSIDHSCDENAAQESFHASLKKECIYQKKPKTKNEAFAMIYQYIEKFYNPIRLHSSINYTSPDTFERVHSIIGTTPATLDN